MVFTFCLTTSKTEFSIGDDFVSQGNIGNIWRHFCCHDSRRDVTGKLWVETRDAVTHPTMHRADPTKDYLAPNANSAKAEKLSFRGRIHHQSPPP